MKPEQGRIWYWSTVIVTFAITMGLIFSCLKDSGHGKNGYTREKSLVADSNTGISATKTVFGTEVGNPKIREKHPDLIVLESFSDGIEMLAENLEENNDTLLELIPNFDAMRFMKQLP